MDKKWYDDSYTMAAFIFAMRDLKILSMRDFIQQHTCTYWGSVFHEIQSRKNIACLRSENPPIDYPTEYTR